MTEEENDEIQDAKSEIICNNCKHRLSGIKCKAFDVIPNSILFRGEKHEEILPNQKGKFVFTELPKIPGTE